MSSVGWPGTYVVTSRQLVSSPWLLSHFAGQELSVSGPHLSCGETTGAHLAMWLWWLTVGNRFRSPCPGLCIRTRKLSASTVALNPTPGLWGGSRRPSLPDKDINHPPFPRLVQGCRRLLRRLAPSLSHHGCSHRSTGTICKKRMRGWKLFTRDVVLGLCVPF